MNETTNVTTLLEENEKLKSDNEMLMKAIAQMKITLNRLITNYIVDDHSRTIV